jgi:PPM family protein phosphatase
VRQFTVVGQSRTWRDGTGPANPLHHPPGGWAEPVSTVVPERHLPLPVPRGAGLTHRGLVRDRNEDAILTDPSGRLWAVADGMGGYGHGEVASDIVIDCLAMIGDGEPAGPALAARLAEANARVRRTAAEAGYGQMGATVVALIVDRAMAHLAWAGDSRAYLFRGRRLRLLTRDHTFVQSLIDRGELSAEEAETHPEAHIVTRAVGGGDQLELDQFDFPLVGGDRLMLCSDGLSRVVYDGAIEQALASAPDPEEAANRLVREALDGGAPDNVSVIVIDIRDGR